MGRYAHLEATEMEIQKKLDKNLDARETNRVARYAVQRDLLERNRERVQAGRLQSETNLRHEMKAQTETLIQRMEREEMELIQRLQNTHSVQQSAMAELENTIAY